MRKPCYTLLVKKFCIRDSRKASDYSRLCLLGVLWLGFNASYDDIGSLFPDIAARKISTVNEFVNQDLSS